MRKLVALVSMVLVGVVCGAGSSGAQEVSPNPGGGSYGATDQTGRPLGEAAQSGYSGTSGPPPTYIVELFDGLRPEEGTYEYQDSCWGVSIATTGNGLTWAEAQETLTEYNDPQAWGVCAAEETFDLETYVLESWQATVRPPPPTPLEVAPGTAVTGLRAYLEIGGDPAPTTSLTNPIGPDIVITMTPRFVVSWGDGATTETRSHGVPYPGGDGEITHVYRDAGALTLTVDAYWTGTWSAGGAGGALPELVVPTSGSLDLPVEQYQAVGD